MRVTALWLGNSSYLKLPRYYCLGFRVLRYLLRRMVKCTGTIYSIINALTVPINIMKCWTCEYIILRYTGLSHLSETFCSYIPLSEIVLSLWSQIIVDQKRIKELNSRMAMVNIISFYLPKSIMKYVNVSYFLPKPRRKSYIYSANWLIFSYVERIFFLYSSSSLILKNIDRHPYASRFVLAMGLTL